MVQPLAHFPETPSQTAGPYVHIGLAPRMAGFDPYATDLGGAIAGPDVPGERIRVEGAVFDGAGARVLDAMIELWQADAAGVYAHPLDPRRDLVAPGFRGWGRAPADLTTGDFAFETVKPGRAPGPDGAPMAPHVAFWITARGINLGLHTRMYFADEAEANAEDRVLRRCGPRAATLLAQPQGDGRYRFDIRLQGDGETVFFDV
jgi:protocatechuate 3,4-dioxygenase alpha subunit